MKRESPSEMRMLEKAPSFCFSRGERKTAETKEEAKAFLDDASGFLAVVHPGRETLSHPEAWAKLFQSSFFVIVCGRKSERSIEKLSRSLSRISYSPLHRNLSGVSVCETTEDAEAIASSVEPYAKGAITLETP